MSERQNIIRLVKDGYTAKEITNELGLKRVQDVYTYARQSGLKVAKANTRKVEAIRKMAEDGMYYGEIAEAVGMDVNTLRKLCKKNNIHVQIKPRQKNCFDEDVAIQSLARFNDDWEYVGGYTGSEGTMDVKHIPCGTVTTKTCTTVRHNRIRCDVCDAIERAEQAEERERRKKIEKEVRRFNKPTKKHKQIKAKECPVCGCFFYDNIAKYCSAECSKETLKHYANMKKGVRRKKAWTAESKTITLPRLYDRDNGVCWICGGVCDYDADPNDNNYPSVDHVIPIACGGKDEWSNIRLAHRLCNSIKGANIVEGEAVGISSRS